jgi:processive 1,2-diacylglycerol beta-glucosyltransferase
MGRVPTVLVLTASYGSGHNAAARSLEAAFAAAGAQAVVVDHFRDLVHPVFERATRRLYERTLRLAPLAWGAAYALGDQLASDSLLTFGATRLGTRRLRRRLEAERPDAVVTVHATPAVAMAALAATGVRVPHTAVVTDFVAHSQWIASGVDRYCVAGAEVKHDLVARGIAPARITVTGVPVRPEFSVPLERDAARAALGLPPDRPVVLAMAGARGGFGRLRAAAQALLALPRPVQGVIVTGHDAALAAELGALVRGAPIRVHGHVGDVRSLMAAADLLVTKAGGMTLAEGLAAELPLILFGSLPGQERRNERFAARNGVALVARSPGELRRALARALDDPGLLERLRANIRRLRRPDASRRVVEVVLAAADVRS